MSYDEQMLRHGEPWDAEQEQAAHEKWLESVRCERQRQQTPRGAGLLEHEARGETGRCAKHREA